MSFPVRQDRLDLRSNDDGRKGPEPKILPDEKCAVCGGKERLNIFLRLLNPQKSSSMISQNKTIESNDRSVQRIKGDRIQLSRCQLQRM